MPDIIFQGTAGRLEGRYRPSKQPNAPLALIMHPHPQHGGTLKNKLVYLMHQAFASRGFSTLRFNFRGVGRSQGQYDEGVGELQDAISALEWLQAINRNVSEIWVAGFSFGSWISMQLLMRRPEITRFISIAPPANLYDFTFLAPCPTSGLIMMGDQDDIVEETAVVDLIDRLHEQRGLPFDYRVISGANHFFQGQEQKLLSHMEEYIDTERQFLFGDQAIAA